MKNYIQSGQTLSFTAGDDIAAGIAVLLGAVLGVNSYDVLDTEEGEAQIEGVFELPKTSANTPAAFATAYWNDTAKAVTTTASGNKKIGFFVKAYGNGDVLAEVKLLPAV